MPYLSIAITWNYLCISCHCPSIHIQCLEEMLHKISVSSSLDHDDNQNSTQQCTVPTPTIPQQPDTDTIAYTSYHPQDLDSTLHTPHLIYPAMADRQPNDTVPLVRPCYRPSSTEPQMKSYSAELLQKCAGFHNIKNIVA